MRSQISVAILAAAFFGLTRGQTFTGLDSLPGCGQTCINEKIAANQGVCPDGSIGCLCAQPEFKNSVLGCSTNSCAADLQQPVVDYMNGVCGSSTPTATSTPVASNTATAPSSTVPAPSTSVPVENGQISTSPGVDTAAAATSTPVTPSTSVPVPLSTGPATSSTFSTTTPPPSSSAPPSSTVPTSTTPSSSETVQAVATSTTSSAATTSPSSTTFSTSVATSSSATSSSSSSSSSSSKTSLAAVPTTSTASSETASATSTSKSEGLSSGAKAGIGIGCAVGGVAVIAILAALVIMRKHKRSNKGHLKISDPMPGSGRIYAGDNANVSELEMKSRRYEDMIPRHSPKGMV